MSQNKISYKQILNSAKDFLVRDSELNLNKHDVVPTASLSHDLGMDSLDTLQLIIDLEKQLNIQIDADAITSKEIHTLAELCYAIQNAIITDTSKNSVYTKNDIYNIISNYLHEQYADKIGKISPKSRWYSDLNLDSFDRLTFQVWVEEKFAIRISLSYLTTIDGICEEIYKKLPAKYKKQSEQKTGFFDKLYDSLYQYKFWQTPNRVK